MKHLWTLLEKTLGAQFVTDKKIQSDVKALSRAFTEDRSSLPENYLSDLRFRQAYLAYYVPLNYLKVHLLLTNHPKVWPATLEDTIYWIDLGCGPGTAVLAALESFKHRYRKNEKLPTIEIDLVDTQPEALELAQRLVENHAELLQLNVKVQTFASYEEAVKGKSDRAHYQLALAANILNELPAQDSNTREPLLEIWDKTNGTMLIVEPGHRVSSQRLIRFRERLLKDTRALQENKVPNSGLRILGPCPHAEKCPVYRSKHWCHFSEPVQDGRFIDLNLRIFKSPREWLKFSYLLFRRTEQIETIRTTHPHIFRAIGDLHQSGPTALAIDLCQPNEKKVLVIPKKIPPELRETLVRGALVNLKDLKHIEAKPMSS